MHLHPLSCRAQSGNESLLAEGNWVKIKVDTTSVYRLPYATLREWGFDDPYAVTVAGYGSVERAHSLDTAPDLLPTIPVLHGEYALYFFGEGDTRIELTSSPTDDDNIPFEEHTNYYSTGSYYFVGLRQGYGSPEITTVETPTNGTPTDTIDTHYTINHKRFYDKHRYVHGLFSYSRDITATSPLDIVLDTRHNAGRATLYYSYIWQHSQSSQKTLSIDFTGGCSIVYSSTYGLNKNSDIAQRLFSRKENCVAALTVDGKTDQITASFSNPTDIFSILALSRYTFVCEKHNSNLPDNYTLRLTNLTERSVIKLKGLTDSHVIWDVTDRRNPKRLSSVPLPDGAGLVSPGPLTGHAVIHTFQPGCRIPVPQYIETMANRSVHGDTGYDMLIVTTGATYDEALRLAKAHEDIQGMKVKVVKQQDIVNEFSSGSLHPNGIRHYIRHLASDSSRPLRYVMMFGPGSWDTRHTFDKSDTEYLATYCTEDGADQCYDTKFISSDLYFGTLADKINTSLASTSTPSSISVGRVPATNADEARRYVDKCITYMTDPVKAGHFNHAIISGGIGDSGRHLEDAEGIGKIIRSHTQSATINRAHLSLFTLSNSQKILSQQLYSYLASRLGGDSRLFTFSGHSGINQISNSMHTTNRELHTSYGSLPVVYMSSCNTTPIDLSDPSIGRAMLLHNPGSIAVIGSGNEVYLNYNRNLQNKFVELFYTGDGGACIGDVFRNAVNASRSTVAQYTNNLCYNFLGDPALPRYLPSGTVTVTEVDGKVTDFPKDSIEIAALSPIQLSGTINTPDGSIDAGFSGKLYLNIYMPPHIQSTIKHTSGDPVEEFEIDEDVIYSSVANVTDGRWETLITLPDIGVFGRSRITLNAISQKRTVASGGFDRLNILSSPNYNSTDTDTIAPIINLSIDQSGAFVTSNPTLHIEIIDHESGPCLNSTGIGQLPIVMLDGVSVREASGLIHASDIATASGRYTFEDLSDGPHTLTVKARDIAGNSSSQSIDITVVSADTTARLNPSERIARSDVSFNLSHSLSTEIRSQRLVIRDIRGNTVLSHDMDTDSYSWDLTDVEGVSVADGTYKASVIIDAHPYYTVTPEIEITVVKLPAEK